MKILIVDDESLARERLTRLITDLDKSHVLIEAENGLQAIEIFHKELPDIVLLDIRMPLMDGLEVAHHLSRLKHPPSFIFTTAYQDHALEAFDTHAVDYLLKPVRKDRLHDALGRADILHRGQIDSVRMNQVNSPIRTHLSANVQGSIRLIPVVDIRYLKAEQKYVIAVSPSMELLLDESLKSLEMEFIDTFIRIHRNALVALKYIESLKKDKLGNVLLSLRDMQFDLQVSRRHVSKVRKILKSGR